MAIHKVTNIFVGNGSALETTVNTLTPGKLGVFGSNQAILATAYAAGGPADSIQFSETFADGSFKKSMWINGKSVDVARSESYAPAQRQVYSIGYNRLLAAGSIVVNPSTEYTATILFKNDKAFYSERPEALRVQFTSSATATQLSIATQIAGAINNGAQKSQITAVVVGNGTGAFGLVGAVNYGVEITAKSIEQFASSTYKENRVYFSVHVDDSTGFGSTDAAEIQGNTYGEGTYTSIFNKEMFDYQYEGLLNRRMWPVQTVKLNANSAPVLSSAIVPTVAGTIGEDQVTFNATVAAILRAGELVELAGVNYEIKYFISATVAVLTTPLTATIVAGVVKVRMGYDIIVIQFTDTNFTTGADAVNQAKKAIYIATPAINAGGAYNSLSTEGTALVSILNTWLATTPANPLPLVL